MFLLLAPAKFGLDRLLRGALEEIAVIASEGQPRACRPMLVPFATVNTAICEKRLRCRHHLANSGLTERMRRWPCR